MAFEVFISDKARIEILKARRLQFVQDIQQLRREKIRDGYNRLTRRTRAKSKENTPNE